MKLINLFLIFILFSSIAIASTKIVKNELIIDLETGLNNDNETVANLTITSSKDNLEEPEIYEKKNVRTISNETFKLWTAESLGCNESWEGKMDTYFSECNGTTCKDMWDICEREKSYIVGVRDECKYQIENWSSYPSLYIDLNNLHSAQKLQLENCTSDLNFLKDDEKGGSGFIWFIAGGVIVFLLTKIKKHKTPEEQETGVEEIGASEIDKAFKDE